MEHVGQFRGSNSVSHGVDCFDARADLIVSPFVVCFCVVFLTLLFLLIPRSVMGSGFEYLSMIVHFFNCLCFSYSCMAEWAIVRGVKLGYRPSSLPKLGILTNCTDNYTLIPNPKPSTPNSKPRTQPLNPGFRFGFM